MKNFLKFVSAGFMFLIFVNLSSGSFNVGNYSVQKIYGPNQTIIGWINISFENEPSNSVFSDSFGNSISLIDLLKNSSGYRYTCNVYGCKMDYSASNSQTTKSFSLNNNEKKILGFKLTGSVNSINSINFNITSNAGVSCNNQLEMDILNDGVIDFINNKSSTGLCRKTYGCFDESKNLEIYSLDFTPYCQKMELDRAPGFKIGALIKKDSGANSLRMSLYKGGENIEEGNCNLADPANSDWQEISCDINYSTLEKAEYYVCILSENSQGDYKLKGYSDSTSKCGFHGRPTTTEVASYKIFAQSKNFDSIGNLAVNNQLANGDTLSAKAQEYVSRTYGNGIDCTSGCIIPIAFKSGYDSVQNIELKNLEIKYVKTSGVVTETNFYDLQEIPAKINSDSWILSLNGGKFYVPSEYGDQSFELKLNNEEILSEDISVERVPVISDLYPLKIPAGVPTKFRINAYSVDGNLTKFEWNFGNSETKQTSVDFITYTYNATGNYNLKVKVTDNNQKSSEKIFEIIVESPKNYINSTLEQKQKNLEDIKTEIRSFSAFEQKILNGILGVNNLDSNLTNLQRRYKTQVNTDNEYVALAREVIGFSVPTSIWRSKSIDSVIFYPNVENIDLSLINEIGRGSYETDRSGIYQNAILAWNQEKLNTKINFKEISIKFSENQQAVKFFKFTISEKENSEKEVFFVLPKLENLEFDGNYNEKEKGDYEYITIESFPKIITFSTTENVDFINLAAFTSPSLSELSVENTGNDVEEPKFNWVIFIIVIILLTATAIVVYIFMHRWYKNNYENYLFKNKNNLYNLMSYIDKSKREGKSDSEIHKNLKNAGWDSEQTGYAIKKYSGKQTGMFEIPFLKILGGMKKNNQTQTGIDTRFGPEKTMGRKF